MDVDCAVMTVVKRASMALTGAQLARGVRLELGRPVKKAVFEESLARVVSEGEIREVQGLTKGKKSAPAYTALGDAELSAAWLEPRLGSGARPVKVTGLRAKLPAVLVPRFEEAIQLLLERGALYEWPAKPGWVLGRKPQPSDVVVGARVKAVTALLAEASTLRASPLKLADFLAWLDGEDRREPPVNELQGGENRAEAGVTEDLLRQWYKADVAGASTSMVSIPQTWRRYQGWAQKMGIEADIQELRRVLEFLYNEGRIWLEPSDRPHELADAEQALMIPMSLGPPGFSWCWAE